MRGAGIRLGLAFAGLWLAACGSDALLPDATAPDAIPQPRCAPGAGGPYWLLEGETVTATAACATGEPLTGADFELVLPPAGMTWDPATATLTWTPGLDQGAVYEVAIRAVPFDEQGVVKIGVADRWNDPGNVLVTDPAAYTEEYGLPVLHAYPSGPVGDVDYVPAQVVYRGHVYAAELKKRGAASLGYPKNSYTIRFAREDKFEEPAFPIWDGGFHQKRKISLTTTFDDNSYIRNRLSFELWNRLDPVGHIRVQAYNAVLFLGGAYYGLYQVTDKIDGFLMEDFGQWQDGNLYKAVNHDANFRLTANDGDPKGTPHDGYEKKEGFPIDGQPGAWDDLDALVSFVATAGDDEFASQIDLWIDRSDYEDWWIFVSLIEGDDSAGKNSYHYHDPTGGRFLFAPWDFNHAFGQTWQSDRQGFDADPEGYAWANRIFERILADPAMGPVVRARYGEALAGVYDLAAVLALVDAMFAEVDAGARRDEEKWIDQVQSYPGWDWRTNFTTYDEEKAYLRRWIADRWGFVDAIY